jgi:hypothetical protein
LYRDGTTSKPYHAGDLMLLQEGLAIAPLRRLHDVDEILVTDLTEVQKARLSSLAPPGVLPADNGAGWTRLRAPSNKVLCAWIARFFAGEPMHRDLGVWALSDARRTWPLTTLTGAALATATTELWTAQVAEGTRWTDIKALELQSLDPLLTLIAAIPVVPVVVLGGLALSSAGIEIDGDGESASPSDGAQTSFIVADTAIGRALFDPRAGRRGFFRVLVHTDAAAGYHGDVRSTLVLGVRLEDVFELTIPLGHFSWKNGTVRQNFLGVGFGLGLHAAPDATSRWALALAVEAGTTIESTKRAWLTAKLGLRWRLGQTSFLGVFPATPAFLEHTPKTGVGGWRVFSGLEYGVAW